MYVLNLSIWSAFSEKVGSPKKGKTHRISKKRVRHTFVFDRFSQILEASWAFSGRSWRHLVHSWASLERSGDGLGGVLGFLRALLDATWPLQVAKMPPEGSPRRSKIDSQRRLALKPFIELSIRFFDFLGPWSHSGSILALSEASWAF